MAILRSFGAVDPDDMTEWLSVTLRQFKGLPSKRGRGGYRGDDRDLFLAPMPVFAAKGKAI